MLPVIAVGALVLRHKYLPKEVTPNRWMTAGLWIAAVATISLMSFYAFLVTKS
jgi:hypothetical protein